MLHSLIELTVDLFKPWACSGPKRLKMEILFFVNILGSETKRKCGKNNLKNCQCQVREIGYGVPIESVPL